jgi:hypothetical protein
MRAILIDPVAETVTTIDLQPGLAAMYAALGCSCIDLRSVGRDPAGRSVDLICDDVGRLTDDQRCFMIGDGMLIAGRALLVASDNAGNTVGTALPLAHAAEKVTFLPEGTDYDPPEPVVIGFSDFAMMKFLIPAR